MQDPDEIIQFEDPRADERLSTFSMPDPLPPTTVVKDPTVLTIDPEVSPEFRDEVVPMLENAGYRVVDSENKITGTIGHMLPPDLLNFALERPNIHIARPPVKSLLGKDQWNTGSKKRRDFAAERKAKKQAAKSRRINRKK